MGRTIFPKSEAQLAAEAAAAPKPPERPACTACGRTKTDVGHVLGLADGKCLSCRLEASNGAVG